MIKELGKLKPMGGALIAFGNDELHNSCGNCSQCSKKCGDAGEKRDRLRIHKNTSFCASVAQNGRKGQERMKGGKKVEEETKKPARLWKRRAGTTTNWGCTYTAKKITEHWKRHRPFGNSCGVDGGQKDGCV